MEKKFRLKCRKTTESETIKRGRSDWRVFDVETIEGSIQRVGTLTIEADQIPAELEACFMGTIRPWSEKDKLPEVEEPPEETLEEDDEPELQRQQEADAEIDAEKATLDAEEEAQAQAKAEDEAQEAKAEEAEALVTASA